MTVILPPNFLPSISFLGYYPSQAMTTPTNQNIGPGEDGREGSRSAGALHYTPESLFVASLIEALRRRESVFAQTLAHDLFELGPIASEDISKILRGMNHRETIAEVLESVLTILRPEGASGLIRIVPEVLPGLVALTEKIVLSEEPYSAAIGDQLIDCTAIAVETLQAQSLACDAARQKISREELESLWRICQKGLSGRDGYWPAVVLLCVLDPSPQSLFHLDQAMEQVKKDVAPEDLILVSVRRAVLSVASSDFAYCLEWIAAHPETSCNRWLVAEATLALTEHAIFHGAALRRALLGDLKPDISVACMVCMFLGQDKRFALPDVLRSDLTEVLRMVVSRACQPSLDNPLAQTAMRALLYMSREERDLEHAQNYLKALFSLGQGPTPELAHSYATSLARFISKEPRRPVIPHPNLSTQTDRIELFNDEISQRLALTATQYVTPRDVNSLYEGFAYDLLSKSRSDVKRACEHVRPDLCIHDLTPRPEESLKLFLAPRDALGFARRYRFIIENGYYDIAAALLPELVSAIDCAVSTSDRRIQGRLLTSVVESVEQLAYNLAARPYLQDFAGRRLSSADKVFLENLPARTMVGADEVPLELSVASLGLRMVIDRDCEWQRELFTLWRECPKGIKRDVDSSSLPYFSVVAERYRPGSAWEMIRKGSVWRDSPGFFRDLCYGLLGDPAYPEAICSRVELNSGEEISKMFALAQGMRDHFSDAQRQRVLKVARASVEELGVLSVESILTISALSTSLDDARLLMDLPAAAGVDEMLHKITCADSMARVLRNIRRFTK